MGMGDIRIINTTVRKDSKQPKPFRQIATCQSKARIDPKEKLTPQPVNCIEVQVGQVWGQDSVAEQLVVVGINPIFVLVSPLTTLNNGEAGVVKSLPLDTFRQKYTLVGG